MIGSIGLFIMLGSSLLMLAEEKEWIVYVKLALFLVIFRALTEIVHKLL
ncbi:MAG: hypothetical protein ABS949_06870 [Solibacillus sp.]